MSQPFSERRRHERIPVETPVTLRVVFPEETFTPYRMTGMTVEFSQTGMRMVTRDTPEAVYRRIIRQMRYAKVSFTTPDTDEYVTLHGSINWVQFDNKEEPPVCTYGIAFLENDEEVLDTLRRFLERVRGQALNAASVESADPKQTPIP